MGMRQGKDKGNVVADYMNGPTRITVYDGAYAGRTEEEIQETLKRLKEICLNIYMRG